MDDRKHSKRLTLRLTGEEYAWLEKISELTGLTHSDWIRQRIREESKRRFFDVKVTTVTEERTVNVGTFKPASSNRRPSKKK